jgi:hypothetical protein
MEPTGVVDEDRLVAAAALQLLQCGSGWRARDLVKILVKIMVLSLKQTSRFEDHGKPDYGPAPAQGGGYWHSNCRRQYEHPTLPCYPKTPRGSRSH